MIKHPKRRGEWVELQFMARAAHHGLTVSKPWGDSARYDFIIEDRGRFARVQVKSTMNYFRGHYQCHCCTGTRKAYTANDIDFMAFYIIPEDVWYIVPVAECPANYSARLNPRSPGNKYFPYLEAWHLLRSPGGSSRRRAARVQG